MTRRKAASMKELEEGIVHRYPMKLRWQIFNTGFGFLTLLIELVRRFYSKVIIFWIKEDPYNSENLPLILEGRQYSYLGIGSEGIVFRFWPLYMVKCTWDKVKLDPLKRKIYLNPENIVGIHHFGYRVNQITLSVSAFSNLKLSDLEGKISQ